MGAKRCKSLLHLCIFLLQISALSTPGRLPKNLLASLPSGLEGSPELNAVIGTGEKKGKEKERGKKSKVVSACTIRDEETQQIAMSLPDLKSLSERLCPELVAQAWGITLGLLSLQTSLTLSLQKRCTGSIPSDQGCCRSTKMLGLPQEQHGARCSQSSSELEGSEWSYRLESLFSCENPLGRFTSRNLLWQWPQHSLSCVINTLY